MSKNFAELSNQGFAQKIFHILRHQLRAQQSQLWDFQFKKQSRSTMRGEPSKARRHSWIYMETESGQHQRRTRGIGAGGQIDIYLNVKQMQQFPGLLVKFIVGRIYCFCARLECTDRKPLVKQFIEEACVQM